MLRAANDRIEPKLIIRQLAANGRFAESSRENVFDFVQGVTAVAPSKPQRDARVVMEGKTMALLGKTG